MSRAALAALAADLDALAGLPAALGGAGAELAARLAALRAGAAAIPEPPPPPPPPRVLPGGAAATVTVGSIADANRARAGEPPTTAVLLAPGDYTGQGELLVQAGEVRSATPLGAQIGLASVGSHGSLADVVVRGGTVRLGGVAPRLWGSVLAGQPAGAIAVIAAAGSGAEVGCCRLEDNAGRGVQVSGDPAPGAAMRGAWVHHNHFRRWLGEQGANTHECVQLGRTYADAATDLGAVLELNLFEGIRVDREVVSIKAHGCLVRGNTLLDCAGGISNRFSVTPATAGGGRLTSIVGNWLTGPGSLIILLDLGALCAWNVGEGGAAIEAMYGTVAAGAATGNPHYPACGGWLIASNAGLPVVRRNFSPPRPVAPSWAEAGDPGPDPGARRLSPAEVGPGAVARVAP